MDDEDDPLAQIIAMLREATRTAGAAGKATHEGMRRRLPSGSPSATARRAMSGPPRASSAASFSARLFSSSPPPGPIRAEPRGRSPAASPGIRGILGATPAFAKCVAAPANSGHRDAAATGSAGRGVFAAWRHSRSGKCSAGGETAPLKAFFLVWLPPRRRGGCFRGARRLIVLSCQAPRIAQKNWRPESRQV